MNQPGLSQSVACDVIDIFAPLPVQLQSLADAVARHIIDVVGTTPAGRVGVSYSGGVDSAVLGLLVARTVGRENTVLILGVSESLAKRERRFAHRQAAQLGLDVYELPTRELHDPRYAANPVTRCYFCKDELFSRIGDDVVDQQNLVAVAYGENADDSVRPDRPGAKAAREHRVLYPLASAGLTKADVRNLANAFGMIAATKPAAPCLASRIPHGQVVTAQKLHAIDLAEDAVLQAGFSDCRVRHHGDIARIEIPEDEMGALLDKKVRTDLINAVKSAGFAHVTIDLDGMKSGLFTLTVLNSRGTA